MEIVLPFVFLFLGIFAGTITGLTPGIHINLIASLIFISSVPQTLPPTYLVIFIVSLSITHTFIDFIPSIYLGAPDEDTALSTLPGHELLLKGKGHQAVKLTVYGSLIAIPILLIISIPFLILIPKTYPFIERMLPFFLIWICAVLIFSEKGKMKISFIIFVLAGFIGIASLNLDISQPLLPLLTGLFGSSTLLYSITTKTKIPKQEIKTSPLSKKELIKPSLITALVSPICSFFPGLGSSQAAIIGSRISSELSKKEFLVLLGSINTLVISVSFLTLYLIGKSRTGSAAVISSLTPLNPSTIAIILASIILVALIATPLTIFLSKFVAKKIHKIPYTKISFFILIFLFFLISLLTGFLGLASFLVSTILGFTSIKLGVRRGLLMGSLLIPTILFYLPFI